MKVNGENVDYGTVEVSIKDVLFIVSQMIEDMDSRDIREFAQWSAFFTTTIGYLCKRLDIPMAQFLTMLCVADADVKAHMENMTDD